MSLDLISDLSKLHARFRPVAEEWLRRCNTAGWNVKVTETLRSIERQKALQAKGLSQVAVGWHNFGLALDFACFTDDGVYITDGQDVSYAVCGEKARELGCVWGGDWTRHPDYDHIEFHPSFTLATYQGWVDDGLDWAPSSAT